jgi:hypothetical protein
MALGFSHVAAPGIDAVAIDQISVQRLARIQPGIDLRDQLGHVLGVREDRDLQHAVVRRVAGDRLLQLPALQADHAIAGEQARGHALRARMGVQYGAACPASADRSACAARFRRWARIGADGIALHVDQHDVVATEPALVAAGDGDRGVLRIDAHREIAAGGRRPAKRGQLARVSAMASARRTGWRNRGG